MRTPSTKIHPLVASAAGAVIVVSLVGTAALLDWLPGSHGDAARPPEAAVIQPIEPAPAASNKTPASKPSASASASAPAPERRTAASPASPVCASCGKVLGVRSVEVEAEPSGVGVVAGAVVGGLLGNQVGGGSGKTLATVAGAVGGGYAGNEIEKRTRKSDVYEVDVQFEDGSRRAFAYETAPAWRPGDRVKMVNGVLAAR